MGLFEKGLPENQAKIIVCDGNFHGRTITIASRQQTQVHTLAYPTRRFIRFITIFPLESIRRSNVMDSVEPIQGEAVFTFLKTVILKKRMKHVKLKMFYLLPMKYKRE